MLLLYYITDRRQFPGNEQQKRERLLAKIGEATRCGVDYVQLREKDLSSRDLLELTRAAVTAMKEASAPAAAISDQTSRIKNSKLLINSRIDVALAARADGVHLTSSDISASDARAAWSKAAAATGQWQPGEFTIAVSCHTTAEVRLAESHGADFAVFAPVFEKVAAPQRPGIGLDALREACRYEGRPHGPEGVGASRMPVLALGGVTLENAGACMAAGAAGIAAIRIFQDHDIREVMARFRPAVMQRDTV
ncbi:MAG TPA: thiamine phosphate synthase [Terriglobales bacterium]|jgi:thiamine-phosphate pyrophosphorylase|nr:thiamine phosphate synthase [Terriglobales bacterium]